MKRIFKKAILAIGILFVAGFVIYQFFGWDLAVRRYKRHVETLLRSEINSSFAGGEKLVYTFRYMGLPSGKAVMRVADIEEYNGVQAYNLAARARTSDFVSLFFEMEGKISAYLDKENLYSLYFEETSQAVGHRKNKKVVIYNQKEHYLVTDGKKVRMLPSTLDPLSAFYLIRLLREERLKEGCEINIKSRKRDRTLSVEFAGKEELRTPFGRIKTIKVNLYLHPVKATSRHEASGSAWYTDDVRRIPLLIKIDTKAGPVSVRLLDLDI